MSTLYVARSGGLIRLSDGGLIGSGTAGERFPGDPGVGKMVIGANHGGTSGTYTGYPITYTDERLFGTAVGAKKMSAVREYNGNDLRVSDGLVSTFTGWANQGRRIMFSFKSGTWTLAQMNAGTADADIDQAGTQIKRVPGAVWVTFWHEPEDDFPTAAEAAVYRSVFRRIIARWKALGVANVAWVSPWYIANTPNVRDWRWWHPNWSGTDWDYDVIDLDGFDAYNPSVAPTATTARNQPWSTYFARWMDLRVADGAKLLPWCIGELGFYTDLATLDDAGTTAQTFFTDMVNVGAATQNLVGVALWNSNRNRLDDANDIGNVKEKALKSVLINNPRVVLV